MYKITIVLDYIENWTFVMIIISKRILAHSERLQSTHNIENHRPMVFFIIIFLITQSLLVLKNMFITQYFINNNTYV